MQAPAIRCGQVVVKIKADQPPRRLRFVIGAALVRTGGILYVFSMVEATFDFTRGVNYKPFNIVVLSAVEPSAATKRLPAREGQYNLPDKP